MQGARPAEVGEQYQARLLDIVADAVVGTDAHFRVTQWNLGAKRLYRYAAAQVLGLPADEVAVVATMRDDTGRVRGWRDRGGSPSTRCVDGVVGVRGPS